MLDKHALRLIMCWCPKTSRISLLGLSKKRASYLFSFADTFSSSLLSCATFILVSESFTPLSPLYLASHAIPCWLEVVFFSYEEFYPDPDKRSSAPGAFSRIVTPQATTRVAGLLERTKGTIVFGGEVDKENKYIAPTVIKDVGPDDSLMSESVLFFSSFKDSAEEMADGIY